jgi:glucosyl-dolichyl phosphate glucuronosyltransferase
MSSLAHSSDMTMSEIAPLGRGVGTRVVAGRPTLMSVSVVICAYTMDRWDALAAAVRSCFEQTHKPSDVIVVIDYNEDLLQRASHEFSGAVVVANRFEKGLSAARNTGIAAARGDVIAFLDDDAFAEPEWLEQLIVPLADPLVAGVGGWVVPHWEVELAPWLPETFYWIIGCSFRGLPANNASVRNPIGANMAMRREVFTSVGGFTSGIGRIGQVPLGCEETELCIRYAGENPEERFVLARDAIVHHRVPESRLTWHYFWTRCWAEGLSKAAVSSLVGSQSGLSAERRHIMRSLPRELGRSLLSLPRHPRSASARTVLILAGTALALAGLLRGRLALRRMPIVQDRSGLEISPVETEENAGPCSVAI